jgi:uroporphyrinogen-III decarboxylase
MARWLVGLTNGKGTPEQVRAQVRDAIEQTDGIGLIVTAGCVISTDTPEENITAARKAVEG